jgi:hypothetical protein
MTMGGSPATKESSSVQQSNPYAPAQGLLDNLLGKAGGVNSNLSGAEEYALNALSGNARAGNQFAPQITGLANTLLGGGGPNRSGLANDAYAQYQRSLNPYLGSDYLNPYNTPGFSDAASTLKGDITSQINGMFAGAGRDLSGMNVQTLARGLSQGLGGLMQNQYNTNVGNQLAAAGSLYGAGGQTAGLLSNLDQTRLGNQQAGITAADAANTAMNWGPMQELAIEAQRRGIPLDTLTKQMGLVLPAAQAFGSKTSESTETSTPASNPTQTAIGIGMVAATLF